MASGPATEAATAGAADHPAGGAAGTDERLPAVPARTAFLVLAGLALLAGLDAALLLADVWAPVAGPAAAHLVARHGMLMVLGFLGTLIALERAVALRATWAYAAPACLGLGGLALAAGLPATLGAVLLADGAGLLIAGYVVLYRRRGDTAVAIETLGALSALVAALLWVRLDVATLILWLVVFVVATIAAERIDLATLALPRGGDNVVLGLASALVAFATLGLVAHDAGARGFGATLLALVAWLARHDIARRTVRSRGLPRFAGAAMLLGYGWLAVAGTVWLVGGAADTQATYDVAVHATFLGFAMSMVLAHAPVILPAIVRRPLPYHPALWAPLGLLHVALAVRVIGDLATAETAATVWRVGSVGTVLALLVLPPTLIAVARTGPRRQGRGPHRRPRPRPTDTTGATAPHAHDDERSEAPR